MAEDRPIDVLVRWQKSSKSNVVKSSDLIVVDGNLKTGAKVKMLWHRGKWWYGTVIDTDALEKMDEGNDSEESDWSSSDEEALAIHASKGQYLTYDMFILFHKR